jgi:hypothetical protein
MGWRGDISHCVDGGAVGPGNDAAVAIGVIDIIGADAVMVFEAIDFAAFVLKKIFHVIIFVVFGWFLRDRVLGDAGRGHKDQ